MASAHFVRFLEKLAPRERNFFLLMDTYRDSFSKYNISDATEHSSVQEFFEAEILRILESEPPIYDTNRKRDEMAERSVSVQRDTNLKAVLEADRLFDENLGEWASSFSDDDDDIKRLANDSDLSSQDDRHPEPTSEHSLLTLMGSNYGVPSKSSASEEEPPNPPPRSSSLTA